MELVFIRHGQSEWNAKNLFTGWRDVPLSEQGLSEAAAAGRKLKEHGYQFDIAFTSVLTRAVKTCNIVLEESGQLFVPQVKTWRLNERHYGALQGLNKQQTAEKYGEEQVRIWRRSYDVLPPLLDRDDKFSAHNDRRYAHLPTDAVPDGENLKVTLERVLPFWLWGTDSFCTAPIRAELRVNPCHIKDAADSTHAHDDTTFFKKTIKTYQIPSKS